MKAKEEVKKVSSNVAMVNSYAARLGLSRPLHRTQEELIRDTGRNSLGEKVDIKQE